MELVITTKDELRNLFMEFLVSSPQSQSIANTQAIEHPICVEEAAAFTFLEVPTIYSLFQKREIPGHRKGRRIYFFKSELVEWIKSGRVNTLNELAAKAENNFLAANKKGRK